MKHLLILFTACTLLLGSSMHSSAQCIDKFGMSGSYSVVSQVWGTDQGLSGFKKEPLHSFSALFFAESYLSRSFSLRSQLGYQRLGYASRYLYDAPAPYSAGESVRLHEFAIDLALKAYLGNKKVRPYLFGGLRSGYAFRINLHEPYLDFENFLPPIHEGNFKKWGLSALSGIGMEVNQRLFVETEFNLGLTPSFQYENTQGYNRGVSFRIGYSFIRPSVCRSKRIGITPLF